VHALPLPDGTKEEAHGHEWVVTATFRSRRLDDTMGAVIDFLAVQAYLREIFEPLDGADLNELPAFGDGRPSTERVAEHITQRLAAAMAGELCPPGGDGVWLRCVNVTEAPGCSATYYADDSGP